VPFPSPRSCIPVLVGLLGLWTIGTARAQPVPAAEGVTRAAPEPAPGPAPPAPEARRVGEVTVTGSIDPPGRLEGLISRMVPRGSYFVEAGPADDTGAPVSTEGRLRRALERLGYLVALTKRTSGAAVDIDVKVRASDRVRYIFILGNWPLRQEDIMRSLTLRAGQALPDAGPERDARLEREKQGVLTFLHDRGYMDARVNFEVRLKRGRLPYLEIVVLIDHKDGYPIGPILVDGARAMSVTDVQHQFQHSNWLFLWQRPLPFDSSLLRQDIAKTTQSYRKLGYAQARVTHDYNPATSVDVLRHQVRLHLSILERKRVEVSFEGNDEFSASELHDTLTIFPRGSYSSYETQVSAEAIEQLYRSKGHLFVKVTWRADSSAADIHRIVFFIHEGPSLKVREVAFQGNRSFSNSRLADVVTVREFPWLGFLGVGEGGYASLRQLELDVERLNGFYAGSGYPGTKVRCEIAPRPGAWMPLGPITAEDRTFSNADGLYVRFVIDEAPRVDVAAVRFELPAGVQLPIDAGMLRDSLDGKVGQPFRPEVVRSDAERLRRLLGDTGYPQTTVEPLPIDNGKNGKELVYQINLGPAERVGPRFIRGNFFTREGTIRRWTPDLPEGAPLTISALERSRRNLALIQILNNPNPISLVEEAEVDGVVPVLVEVEERHDHSGVVRVGGGASTEQSEPGSFPLGAYAALGYEHRNLFGQSWLWTSRAELGRSLTRVSSDFNNPRFFDSLFRLRLTGSYLRQNTVRLGDLRSGTGTVGLERELTSGLDLSFHYRLSSTVRTEYLLRGGGPDGEQETVAIGTVVGAFGLVLEWQRLDSPLVPTRGFKLQAGIEWANPRLSARYGEDTFLKATVRTLNVVPVSRRVSVRYSLRYDQGFPLGGAALLPKVERFFAGGDTTLRGFELDRARTDDVRAEPVPGLTIAQHRPLGGSLRILQNLDLQIEILGAWFGGVFIDSGVVADAFDGLSPQSFRHGAGIAPLVVKLPIGDLSIAWAWPLDPKSGDSASGRLHFNVGLMY
jgi:outer membrane protein insertion porin family